MNLILNIFNSFDPTSMPPLNWSSSMIFILLFPFQFWLIPSRYILIFSISLKFLLKEFKILMNFHFSNLIILIPLFIFIFFNNFMGLFPFIFTASSHFSFCSSLSISIWLSIMMFNLMNFYNLILSHLIPSNSPLLIMPFMVIIEFISMSIRPLTLTIRLTANIMSGHLILSLLSNSTFLKLNLKMYFILILLQIILFFLEIFMSIIQSYIFSLLSIMYSSEL